MRGASALDQVLAAFPQARLHVQVVWEPVLATDVAAPFNRVLGLIDDPRVTQYWDPDLVLSAEIVRAVNGDPSRYGFEERLPPDFVVWDVVAIFPGSAGWDRDLPVPVYYGGPVLNDVENARRAIAAELDETMRAP